MCSTRRGPGDRRGVLWQVTCPTASLSPWAHGVNSYPSLYAHGVRKCLSSWDQGRVPGHFVPLAQFAETLRGPKGVRKQKQKQKQINKPGF